MGAIQDGTAYTLTATDRHAVSDGFQVRRFTPAECERLQGFPAGTRKYLGAANQPPTARTGRVTKPSATAWPCR